jgi:hypothetical protein
MTTTCGRRSGSSLWASVVVGSDTAGTPIRTPAMASTPSPAARADTLAAGHEPLASSCPPNQRSECLPSSVERFGFPQRNNTRAGACWNRMSLVDSIALAKRALSQLLRLHRPQVLRSGPGLLAVRANDGAGYHSPLAGLPGQEPLSLGQHVARPTRHLSSAGVHGRTATNGGVPSPFYLPRTVLGRDLRLFSGWICGGRARVPTRSLRRS